MRYGLPLSIFFHAVILAVVLIGLPVLSKPMAEKSVEVPVEIVRLPEPVCDPLVGIGIDVGGRRSKGILSANVDENVEHPVALRWRSRHAAPLQQQRYLVGFPVRRPVLLERYKLLELLLADDGGDPVGALLLADRSAALVRRPRLFGLHVRQQGDQVERVLLGQIEVFQEQPIADHHVIECRLSVVLAQRGFVELGPSLAADFVVDV